MKMSTVPGCASETGPLKDWSESGGQYGVLKRQSEGDNRMFKPWKMRLRRIIGPKRWMTFRKATNRERYCVRRSKQKKKRREQKRKRAWSIWWGNKRERISSWIERCSRAKDAIIAPFTMVQKARQAGKWAPCFGHAQTIGRSIMMTALITMLLLMVNTCHAMDTKDGGKQILGRMPTFSGNKDDFAMWWMQFMAIATMFKWHAAVKRNGNGTYGESNCPATQAEHDAIQNSDADADEKREAWKRNNFAMSALILCMPTKLFRLVQGANGLAKTLVKSLHEEYKPDDQMAAVEAERQYSGIRMNDNTSPRFLQERFAQIAADYPASAATEARKITIVLSVAPDKYQTVLAVTQERQGGALTSQHLIDSMMVLYRQQSTLKQRGRPSNNGTSHETGLAAPGANTGICWNCGKPGHRAAQCRSPSTNNKFKPGGASGGGNARSNRDMVCHECGLRGHKKTNCWCLEENASKRPPGWKPPANYRGSSAQRGEQSSAHIDFDDDDGFELMMPTVMTFPKTAALLTDPNIWIADSAASTHSTGHKIGMTKLTKADASDAIKVGNGDLNAVEAIGDVQGTFHAQDGEEQLKATLQGVSYSPSNAFNLISIPQLMNAGWRVVGEGDRFVAERGDLTINFDIVIPTKRGKVYAVCFKRTSEVMAVHANGTKERVQVPLNINRVHAKLGHASEASTRETAKALGIELTRHSFKPCVACGMGKAKQKNVRKSVEPETVPDVGERMHADISTIKRTVDTRAYVKPNWFMLVDAATGIKFSTFWKTKNAFIEPTCAQLHRWMKRGIGIRKIRCDNAGENKAWEARCHSADWKLDVQFEYTAARTPQQNSKVEVGFAIIANKGRSLLAAAHIPAAVRRLIWNEAFGLATLLDALVVVTVHGIKKTRWEHWYKALPSFVNNLRTFGEAGIVKTRDRVTPKTSNRGAPCLFVGYPRNHPGDTYRMYDPKSGGIHEVRDVIWLRRMFYETPLAQDEFQIREETPDDRNLHGPFLEIDSSDALEEADAQPDALAADESEVPTQDQDPPQAETPQRQAENDNDTPVMRTRTRRNIQAPKRYDEMTPDEHDEAARRRQQETEVDDQQHRAEVQRENEEVDNGADEGGNEGDGESDAPEHVEEDSQDEEEELAEACIGQINMQTLFSTEIGAVGASLGGGFENTAELKPMKYDQAMAGPDKHHWEKAVVEEFERFQKHQAVEAVPRGKVPMNTRIMDSTWACKKKSNGTFRARLNLRGFKQVDGEHFDSHNVSSPVANIITIHIVLALITIIGWFAVLVDVRGAFLLGEWEQEREIYMEVPQGWELLYPPNTVLRLLKTVYGAKQSAKRFWILTLKTMDKMQFVRSKADPCLYYTWHEQYGLILIVSWVDDMLICGTKPGVEYAKGMFMKHFDCDDTGEMKEYVGNKITKSGGMMKLTQPVLLQSFEDEFEFKRDTKVMNPAVPGTVLHPTESKLSNDDQFLYRSGTGKLLHLMKWSRPEIGNAVRELSRFMSGAGPSHMKAMWRVMNYCLNTRERGKVFKPRRNCTVEQLETFEFVIDGYSDSDYAKDPVRRRSVTGYATFLEGCVINTKSRMQPITALSVTEAELVAATECAQDLLYAKHVLESIGLKVKGPMVLNIDNSGCIDLICNWSAGGRTRHMETRMYWMRELKEEEPPVVMPTYCPTKLNRSDIFTKNCDTATFEEHVEVFCEDEEFE